MKISFLAAAIVPVPFLTTCSLYTRVMLIWNLIDVQYLQNVVFSSDKGSNGPNHSWSDFHHPIKKMSRRKTYHSLHWGGFPILKRYLENLFILILFQEENNVFQYNINQRRKPKIHHHRYIFDSPIKTTVESYSWN